MHYSEHGDSPEPLKKYKSEYTQKWLDYYPQGKGKKPNDYYWTIDEIREPLRECFEDNCGYCGVGMGRRPSKSGKMLPLGKVDHFLPKSQCPLYVYYWENYIWCCTDCNETKREYYDPDCMLFYPCDKEDTRMLELRADGKYYLKNEFVDDEDVIKRYQATCRETLMNSGRHPEQRSAKKNELEILLTDLMDYWNRLRSNNFEDSSTQLKLYIEKNFKESKSRLKHILESSSYKKMIRSIMEQFLEKEPVLYEIMAEEHVQ